MKCQKCGYEQAEQFAFCPQCGADTFAEQASEAVPSVANPVCERVGEMLNNPLYLVICILQSVMVFLSFLCGQFPLLSILMLIFMWLVFAKVQNKAVDVSNMRNISGTVFAYSVILWVAFGLVVLVSVISAVVFAVLGSSAEFWDAITSEITVYAGAYTDIVTAFLSVSGFIVVALLLMIAALVAVFAVGQRKIHLFAQSLYKSAAGQAVSVVNCKAAQGWLIAFGIINAVSAVFSILEPKQMLLSGCSAAIYIIASQLIKKHFPEFN